jgi:hypothetical protein
MATASLSAGDCAETSYGGGGFVQEWGLLLVAWCRVDFDAEFAPAIGGSRGVGIGGCFDQVQSSYVRVCAHFADDAEGDVLQYGCRVAGRGGVAERLTAVIVTFVRWSSPLLAKRTRRLVMVGRSGGAGSQRTLMPACRRRSRKRGCERAMPSSMTSSASRGPTGTAVPRRWCASSKSSH